ncbi:MAG: hypothetical protein ABI305_10985 [Tepidiformaceae bacterium]
MTTVVRSLRDDGTDGDDDGEREAALQLVNELLNDAHKMESSRDSEWVVDLASRRVVRRTTGCEGRAR